MNVVTVQSEVWNQLTIELNTIKQHLANQAKKQPLSEPWLTVEEVMELLKISRRSLQKYRDEGMVAFSQVKGKIYFKASDIEDFLQRNYIEARK